ncbi:TIGR04282 family arsenosugar biosynthesis glycosyltransferase [Arhodomonas sp. AD133]|uniref:TIGR04282 family arsenosugar biosynthesis glycosyltransferase n=1 Tax=Arhodomonas sp. AD133 TaxID=3415009 RepID=UPI003EBC4D67
MSAGRPLRLIVFAKPPLRGHVKTRLARRIGHRAATSVYRVLLADTLMRLSLVPVASLELCASGRRHPSLWSLARRAGAEYRLQGHGDLGQRMQRATARALSDGFSPVIVGADCAGVSAVHVGAAFDALDDGADAVFAPADDGGYALIGLSRPLPGLFHRMPWGMPAVMARTRRRLAAQGLCWRELPGAWDVDDWRSLRRWRRERCDGGWR